MNSLEYKIRKILTAEFSMSEQKELLNQICHSYSLQAREHNNEIQIQNVNGGQEWIVSLDVGSIIWQLTPTNGSNRSAEDELLTWLNVTKEIADEAWSPSEEDFQELSSDEIIEYTKKYPNIISKTEVLLYSKK